MAAYAALCSLKHIINQINDHPRPPISLDKTQVESLTETVAFLQEFLEGYSQAAAYSKEADPLEMRIADAAYAAEDAIESYIADQVLGEEKSSTDLYGRLKKVIEDMESVRNEVLEIEDLKMGVKEELQPAAQASSLAARKSSTTVGFDGVLLEVMELLVGGQPDRGIIPIVGMGGIGKTTLARTVYQNQAVVEHFDIHIWVTISQSYKLREVVSELLRGVKGREMSEYVLRDEMSDRMSSGESREYGLLEELYKELWGRRYLIIMDDIWDNEAWDKLSRFFPDNKNGSRIVLTTRLGKLASDVANSEMINVSFLNEDHSWELFSRTVFGEEGCPPELEETGKKIVRNCKGLPLSIVVIGGLVVRSKPTREYWEYIAENLNAVVNLEDDGNCFRILHLSYAHLPVYLKPCFLYMGVFPEDSVIRVSKLVKLWVAEGILKQIMGKSLEETAKEYLNELVCRNLIFVEKLGCTGKIKECMIHDLLRDLCLREAEKELFYYVTRDGGLNVSQDINTQRRVVIPNNTAMEKDVDAFKSKLGLVHSLICNSDGVVRIINFRLLRIVKTFDICSWYEDRTYFFEGIFELVNSRYIAVIVNWHSKFSSSVELLWNLQTLIVENCTGLTAPVEFWNMTQLRHIKFRGLRLPNPRVGGQDDIVLENLQTLERIVDFKFGEEVVKRISNVTKLSVEYTGFERSSVYCLHNLGRLHKLESFTCYSSVKQVELIFSRAFSIHTPNFCRNSLSRSR